MAGVLPAKFKGTFLGTGFANQTTDTLTHLHLLPEPSPCLFERLKDLAPQKRRSSRLHSDNRHTVFLGCQLAKCPTAKNRPRIFRPTVQCEMAKSLIARKDRGSAWVVCYGAFFEIHKLYSKFKFKF